MVAPVFAIVVDVVVTILTGLKVGDVVENLVGEGVLAMGAIVVGLRVGEAVPTTGAIVELRVGEEVGPWVEGVDGGGGAFQQLPL